MDHGCVWRSFAAGLVAATDAASRSDNFLRIAVLTVFAFLAPVLVMASSWHWLGEITRMERVAVYLRGIEFHLGKHPTRNLLASMKRPLNWEL